VSQQSQSVSSRRTFLKAAGLGAGMSAAATITGCGGGGTQGPGKRLKAAFSNGGLAGTWCQLGKQTAELWGELLNVEIVWKDGEYDDQAQRAKIDLIVDQPWDFCCIQANQTGFLAEPVKQLHKNGVPVISMDVLLVEKDKLRKTGVWTHVTPDHVYMAESSTQYLMDKIGGKGNVIHIGGYSGHSGAVGRKTGFDNIVAKYPDVTVVGGDVRWCDWKKEKARNTFEALLEKADGPVAGAFFHNDDMALASQPAIVGTRHEDMIVTSVDGQKEGLGGVEDGKIHATTVNPACAIHATSLFLGVLICRNEEKMEDLPLEIITPGPLVSKETGNLEAMLYLSDAKHCLV